MRTLRESTFVFAKSRKKKEKKENVASKRLTFEIRVNALVLREQRNKYLKTQIEKLYFLGGKGDRKLFVLTKFKVEPATDQAGKILFSLDQANARYFERSSPRFNKI